MTDVLRLSIPLTFWLISFSAIYGLHGFVCSVEWAGQTGIGNLPLDRVVLVAGWAGAVLAQTAFIAVLATARFGSPGRFNRRISLALAVTALIAAIWTLSPVAMLPTCQ